MWVKGHEKNLSPWSPVVAVAVPSELGWTHSHHSPLAVGISVSVPLKGHFEVIFLSSEEGNKDAAPACWHDLLMPAGSQEAALRSTWYLWSLWSLFFQLLKA